MNFERTIASVQTPENVLAPIPAADTHGAGEAAELDLSTLLIESEADGPGLLILPDPEHTADSRHGAPFVEVSADVVRAVRARASKGAL